MSLPASSLSLSHPSSPEALQIPEILERIGRFIPLWGFDEFGAPIFLAHNLLPCLSVSHHFRRTLLPTFWYTLHGESMHRIPLEVVKTYAPFIRILDGCKHVPPSILRLGRPPPTFYSPSLLTCTRLFEFSSAGHYMDEDDLVHLIQQNPQLRRISWKYRTKQNEFDEDLLEETMTRLEHARLEAHNYSNHEFPNLLRLMAPTLVSLQFLDSSVALDSETDLVFPRLKELEVQYHCTDEFFEALPRMCPEIESLKTELPKTSPRVSSGGGGGSGLGGGSGAKNSLAKLLASKACPKLNRLYISVPREDEERFSRVLDSHPGLEALGVWRLTSSTRAAVMRQGRALKSLALYESVGTHRLRQDEVVEVLRSCTQLVSLELHDLGYRGNVAIDWVLNQENFGGKTAESLERLTLSGSYLTIGEVTIRQPMQFSLDVVAAERMAGEAIRGWKVQSGLLVQDLGFLEKFFGVVNERFPKLRSATLNRVVYNKLPV